MNFAKTWPEHKYVSSCFGQKKRFRPALCMRLIDLNNGPRVNVVVVMFDATPLPSDIFTFPVHPIVCLCLALSIGVRKARLNISIIGARKIGFNIKFKLRGTLKDLLS